jgi:hypothetical protein
MNPAICRLQAKKGAGTEVPSPYTRPIWISRRGSKASKPSVQIVNCPVSPKPMIARQRGALFPSQSSGATRRCLIVLSAQALVRRMR